MTDPNAYTLSGLGALFIINVSQVIMKIYENRKKPSNGKPGTAEECIKRGKKIAVFESEVEHIKNSLEKIDKKLDTMNGKK